MALLSVRLSDEQKLHLDTLSAKTGYNSSDIVRNLIDNVDEVTLTLALQKIDERKAVDIEKIASQKYQNYLLNNLANNLNQVAHFVNKNANYIDKNITDDLSNKLSNIKDELDEVKVKLNGNS